jgi:hypothetical protein
MMALYLPSSHSWTDLHIDPATPHAPATKVSRLLVLTPFHTSFMSADAVGCLLLLLLPLLVACHLLPHHQASPPGGPHMENAARMPCRQQHGHHQTLRSLNRAQMSMEALLLQITSDGNILT